MSYQVLARKWRPQGFDEVTGQSHVTTPLRNAIRMDRVPHAILLTGPRGVGKTTLARILARCLNCDKGPTDTPCGECPPCTEIAAGTSTDVQEIDAASRTSVEDVRELISAIRYAAAPGKHRIFVVDEVHMLSTAAFNALLKTLEEPPPQSLFVFATTNPEKIPFTVISRCQRYDLRRIAASEIVERLAHITRAEKVKISDGSLLAIAREADGSLRDGQTLLDQVIAYGGSEIDDEQVAEVLDLIDRRQLLAIAEACVDGDPARALAACTEAGSSGADAKRLSETLLQMLRDLVVLSLAPDREGLVEASEDEVAELRALAERTDTIRLRRMFRALVKEQEDLAWAPQPFAVLEMAVVRLACLPAGDDVARLIGRLDALERRLAGGGGPGGGPSGSGAGPSGSSGGPSGSGGGPGGPGRTTSASGPTSRTDSATKPRSGPRRAAPAAQAEPTAATAERTSPTAEPAAACARRSPDERPPAENSPEKRPLKRSLTGAPLPVVFDRLRAFVKDENAGIYAALEGSQLVAADEEGLRIAVPQAFAARRLQDKTELLEKLSERFFGQPTPVRIEAGSADGSAGSDLAAGPDPELARQRRAAALKDPGVGRALEILGGEIVDILPLGEHG